MAKGIDHPRATPWCVTAVTWFRRQGLISGPHDQGCQQIAELDPRARRVYWLLLLVVFGLPGVVTVAGGAAQPDDSQGTVAGPVPALHFVSVSEAQATLVFTTRIINRAETALRLPRLHLHAPLQLPHQSNRELDVEGNPERLTDRWGAPVLSYQRQELAPGTSLLGRWTAWATVRRFRWGWGATVETGGTALSPEEGGILT